ncbi:MAG: Vitamin B12 ABC transporter, substrate-binding protein BtuF, partial [uncultured Pseudonocardia sp.]
DPRPTRPAVPTAAARPRRARSLHRSARRVRWRRRPERRPRPRPRSRTRRVRSRVPGDRAVRSAVRRHAGHHRRAAGAHRVAEPHGHRDSVGGGGRAAGRRRRRPVGLPARRPHHRAVRLHAERRGRARLLTRPGPGLRRRPGVPRRAGERGRRGAGAAVGDRSGGGLQPGRADRRGDRPHGGGGAGRREHAVRHRGGRGLGPAAGRAGDLLPRARPDPVHRHRRDVHRCGLRAVRHGEHRRRGRDAGHLPAAVPGVRRPGRPRGRPAQRRRVLRGHAGAGGGAGGVVRPPRGARRPRRGAGRGRREPLGSAGGRAGRDRRRGRPGAGARSGRRL